MADRRPADVRIRPATGADLPAIAAIYNHAIRHTAATWDLEEETVESRRVWWEAHCRAGLPVLVAERPGLGVVGWGSLSPFNPKPGWRFTVENSLYVAPDQRGQGIGRRLLEALIAEARALGMHSVIAAIDGGNEVSLRLHRRLGFVEAGRLREAGWKFDQWHDAVYLQLLL
ncbi:MAG: N-acetyltransferase family protein [Verrucomicrobia bacterium]|nr:MAG: N-acetyltransferase family protein [Verrucomicrobiota bacterium]